MFDIPKLIKWTKNTKNNHRQRGIPIPATPTQILNTTLNTIIEHEGYCPECGNPLNQNHLHPHQLSLENLGNGNYEIICRSCNIQRNHHHLNLNRGGFND